MQFATKFETLKTIFSKTISTFPFPLLIGALKGNAVLSLRCPPDVAWRANGAKFGLFSYINPGCTFGRNVYIGMYTMVGHKTHIGNYTQIGNFCSIAPGEHRFNSSQGNYINSAAHIIGEQATAIGDGCWIGSNSFVKRGVTIGTKTTVGALTSVTKNCDPESVYVGCPAKKIRNISV